MGQPIPTLMGQPIEFFLFGATLIGVAVLHKRPLMVATVGLIAVLAYELVFSAFPSGHGVAALGLHLRHEWVTLTNLLLLLVGFELLSDQFERSNLPDALPRILPDDWLGGVALLAIVFVLSAFLDNIAAAVIGGVMARHAFRGRVRVAFLAAIVAAANAGGAGSVVGDTTTTMLWIGGVSPDSAVNAYLAAVPAFLVFAGFGAWAQHRHQPILAHVEPGHPIDWTRVGIVGFMLGVIILANVASNAFFPWIETFAPVLGLALWGAILLSGLVRKPGWSRIPAAGRGALFLVMLVAAASLMPVASLPSPSWGATLGVGALSAVFDNIPLTALALEQGGHDWALLAYAVGFGGSMIWFGSSAGVALTNGYPEGRSVLLWLREGWFVPVAYVVGFFIMLAVRWWLPADLPGPA